MHTKIVTSSSLAENDKHYQPGGTSLVIVEQYAPSINAIGSDSSGLGRWAYTELLGKHNCSFLIMAAYWVGNAKPTIGLFMVVTQQYNILFQQGFLEPSPHKQFITNLIQCIQHWQHAHEILVWLHRCNEELNDSTMNGVSCLLEATDLIDLHCYWHPYMPTPATHHCGRLAIDYCLGTSGFASALIGAQCLPFGVPETITENQWTLGLEFDHDILFGNKIPQSKPTHCHGVYSNIEWNGSRGMQ